MTLQTTLDNQELEQKIIKNKNSIEIDLYNTTNPKEKKCLT